MAVVIAFATAVEWVNRLRETHDHNRLREALRRLGRIPLLVIDDVGYIPFESEAANLFFQLISNRYERASVIVTSNKPFGRWGEHRASTTVELVPSCTPPLKEEVFTGADWWERGGCLSAKGSTRPRPARPHP